MKVLPAPRTRSLGGLTVAIALLASPSALVAQVASGPAASGSAEADVKLMVVRGDDVFVRAGAADSYYPFGRLQRGDLVRVTGEKHGWTRVVTEGEAFASFFGYIRYRDSEGGAFRLEDGGRTGRALGRIRVLAPNLNTGYQPNDSWKRILLIEPGRTVKVLETTASRQTTVHKIALPVDAEGWINASDLEPATAQQANAWKRAAAGVMPREEMTIAPVANAPGANAPGADALETEAIAADLDRGWLDDLRPSEIEMGEPGERRGAPADMTVEMLAQEPVELPVETAVETPAEVLETLEMETTTLDVMTTTPPGANAPVSVAPSAVAPAAVARSAEEQLQDLEIAYAMLQREPIATAEVAPLRALFAGLAADYPEEKAVARYADARAEQLTIWAELQKRRAELDRLTKEVELTAEEASAMRLAIEAKGLYVAAGRLTTSVVYDGVRLPKLFRVQDPKTGRTIAYLRPDDGFDLFAMLDQLVGIVGHKEQDATLHVKLVEPRRIDLLGGS